MTLSNLEVIRVMSRCDLYCTGSKLFIYIVIRHDRNLFIHQRKQYILAYDIFVSLIVRVYGNSCISQHCLRTCCCDLQKTICSYDRIFDVPEVACLLLMLYLCI